MQTKQAIQTSANVIRITSVSAGDVYKRFDNDYDDRTYYGVIKAVHNDGINTIIEALEYCYKYSSIDIQHKIIRGEKDYVIYPSSPEELNLEFGKAIEEKERQIKARNNENEKDQKVIDDVQSIMAGDMQKKLKAMSYKELTQEQYNEQIKAIADL
jgi:hypothetical protein